MRTLILTDDCGGIGECNALAEVERAADALVAARPDSLVIDAAAGDNCCYPGSVGHFYDNDEYAPKGAAGLVKAGHDPLGIVYARLRAAGIPTLAGFRMNDHHGCGWTPWMQAHIPWSLGRDTGDRGWNGIAALRQMDYAVSGVRERYLAVLDEILTRYELDGLHLDFGRSAPFVSEPKREKGRLLTQFVRDVRSLVDRRAKTASGGRGTLGVIVPWDLEFCEKEGVEVTTWVREGLLDHVSPGEWYYNDWNLPIHRWAHLTRGTRCALVPMILGSVSGRPYSGFEQRNVMLLADNGVLDGPKARALAETYFDQGADGINFYNVTCGIMPGVPADKAFGVGRGQGLDGAFFGDPSLALSKSLRQWLDPDAIAGGSRHYFYARRLGYRPTANDDFFSGAPFARLALRGAGATAALDFRFGADLKRQQATLRFKTLNAETTDLAVALNGVALGAPRQVTTPDAKQPHLSLWEFAVAAPPLRRGDNTIAFTSRQSRDGTLEIGELEILVPALSESVRTTR